MVKKHCSYCGREGHFANECSWPRKGNVKLTREQVAEIRSRFAKRQALLKELNPYTDKGIARDFGSVTKPSEPYGWVKHGPISSNC